MESTRKLLLRLIGEVAALRAEVRELRRQRVDRVTVQTSEAAVLLGCERTAVFEHLRAGHLKRGRRVGRKTMVTRASIDDLLAGEHEPVRLPKTAGGSATYLSDKALCAVERDKVLALVRKSRPQTRSRAMTRQRTFETG